MAEDTVLTQETLRRRLGNVATSGPPQVAALARWALDHPHELAFHSVRGLATRAEVNANTVVRLAQALGFKGYDQCRSGFQTALRETAAAYGERAARLRNDAAAPLNTRIHKAAVANTNALFLGSSQDKIEQTIDLLEAARRVYCIGVRSCFSVAHYFAYTGQMAFRTFSPPLGDPGAIIDSLASSGPEDVVVLATYSHYSAEILDAHRMAQEVGARIVALTDSYTSPIASGAHVTFCLPMAGPQPMPSLGAYFLLVETLVATMIARSDTAIQNVAEFEARRIEIGAYLKGPATTRGA